MSGTTATTVVLARAGDFLSVLVYWALIVAAATVVVLLVALIAFEVSERRRRRRARAQLHRARIGASTPMRPVAPVARPDTPSQTRAASRRRR